MIDKVRIILDSIDDRRPPHQWRASIDHMPFADVYWIEDKSAAIISVYNHCITPQAQVDDACAPLGTQLCAALQRMRQHIDTRHCTLRVDASLVYSVIDLPGR